MKTTLLTTASDPQHPGWLQFKRSLDHFGWDYHLIVHEYTGYNSKIVAFYNYLKEHPEITHFIYADSYDSFALSTQQEAENKFTNWDGLMYGVEKACWPYEDWAKEYPDSPYPHRYLNGGGFMGSSAAFVRMYEANPIWESGSMNDQVYSANEFLRRNNGSITLDRNCSIFQTTGHSGTDDFAVLNLREGKRVMNLNTMSCPILLHGNGKTPMEWIYDLLPEPTKLNIMNLADLKEAWQNTPEFHTQLHETFVQNVNNDELLKASRDYVESNIWGFGERSFWWLWKLICEELPPNPAMIEIGIFRGATISLWKLLRPDTHVFGITPLDTSGDMWESDYAADIAKIHDDFKLAHPKIFVGRSEDLGIVEKAGQILYDLVYVDGLHTYENSLSDLTNYSPMVKKGGYLVIDDCNNDMDMVFGTFCGIQPVTDAKLAWLATNPPFIFICSVVHISVYQRI